MPEQYRFQPEPDRIRWRVHFRKTPDVVYEYLTSPEKRKLYWAESAEEQDGIIHFRFLKEVENHARILEKGPGRFFKLEYFGTLVSFELSTCDGGGCDMTVECEQFEKNERWEFVAGWVSWLLTMKAAVDFGVDLRNHDPERTWFDGFADN